MEDMLKKVRGLLDTAESLAEQGNVLAAENYTAKAHQLLTKYDLDMAMVEGTRDKPEEIVQKVLECHGRYWQRWSNLLHHLALAGGRQVRTVHSKSRRKADGSYASRYASCNVTVIGFESDVASLELLWTSLTVQAMSAMQKASVPAGVNRWTYQINFLDAFDEAVCRRLKVDRDAAVKERETEEGGKLLPVLAERRDRVEEKMKERYGTLRKGAATGARTSSVGAREGYAAGRSATLGGTSLPSTRKAIGQ